MNRLAAALSKILIGSVLLSNTAYAYPVEYFPNALPVFNRQIIREPILKEPIRFGDKFKTETKDILIVPAKTSSNYVTRGDLVKSVVDGLFPGEIPASCFSELSPSINYWSLFSDVPNGSDYGPFLCKAMINGMVKGYPDSSFRPYKSVNYAEAAKILAKAYGLANDSPDPGIEWHAPFVHALKSRNALPEGVMLDESVTPQNLNFMISRLARRT